MSVEDAGWRRLELDRPSPGLMRIRVCGPGPRGAMDAQTHRECAEIWRAVDADRSVRAVLLTGRGGEFSAGGDVRDQIAEDAAEARGRMLHEARELVYGLLDCRVPVVCAVRGAAAGAGLALALLSDVSVVAEEARLADGHIRIGLAAGDHAAIVWPLLCGVAKAKHLLLTGDSFSGREAERMNMVSLAVPDGEVDERALEIASRLAAGPPEAMRATKQAINQWVRQAAPIFEAALHAEVVGAAGPEGAEGAAAFVERRSPRWT